MLVVHCVCVSIIQPTISSYLCHLFFFSPVPVVKTEFNDTRCGTSELVCPNDPLLYTCNVIGITENELIKVVVPFIEVVFNTSETNPAMDGSVGYETP